MNTKRFLNQTIGLVLVLLLLTACNSTPSTPTLTLTIKGNTCTLDGPKAIPFGKYIVNWTAEDDGQH
jgi:hypothetical protein